MRLVAQQYWYPSSSQCCVLFVVFSSCGGRRRCFETIPLVLGAIRNLKVKKSERWQWKFGTTHVPSTPNSNAWPWRPRLKHRVVGGQGLKKLTILLHSKRSASTMIAHPALVAIPAKSFSTSNDVPTVCSPCTSHCLRLLSSSWIQQ
jgi:hypothetical protein